MNEDLSSSQYVKFSARIDDRGRIFIPADIKKTLGLNPNDCLDLLLSVSDKSVKMRKNGCSRPMARTSDCGSDNPGSTLNDAQSASSEFPGCGPKKEKRRER